MLPVTKFVTFLNFHLNSTLLLDFLSALARSKSFTDFDLVLFLSPSGTLMTNALEAHSQRKFAKSTMSSATWVAGVKVGRV